MNKIYVFLAPGFETIEALGAVDVFRRAGLPVQMVSTTDTLLVESAHHINIEADIMFEQVNPTDAALLYLPGGMPGAANLQEHEGLARLIRQHYDAGRPLAAICAAPMVYGAMGLLDGLEATCYPGFEDTLLGATPTGELVVRDGQFFLGKGPAAVLELSFTIVAHFCGEEKAEEVRDGMLYNEL
ncbi:MAG: DJ-1/PfpI family protein [Bacteroidaceae bacterium]|nr:DJ-1/PfpI family protein [Bacteroidaceae bacterium]MDO4994649.1 DJ-1/PfpI family protein [Bacteroidales bacterium]